MWLSLSLSYKHHTGLPHADRNTTIPVISVAWIPLYCLLFCCVFVVCFIIRKQSTAGSWRVCESGRIHCSPRPSYIVFIWPKPLEYKLLFANPSYSIIYAPLWKLLTIYYWGSGGLGSLSTGLLYGNQWWSLPFRYVQESEKAKEAYIK